MGPEITKFCPECEREYPISREMCPADGTPLMKYEVVEDQHSDRLVGTTLDERYRVDEPISEGGMGKVYRGTQTKVGREVAIKVLVSDPSRKDTQMRRFLREARTLSKLSHPNIVNFIDFGQDPRHDAVYLVMELIEGRDLSELLDQDRLDPALVLQIGIQVCSALSEPHHEGVVHRDLKPANLMLSARVDGTLETKLVDFGITNAVHDQTRLTQTGAVCGTPHYMAPEQIDGGSITPAADLYALGAILFHLVTGEVLFDGKSDIQVLFSHVQEPPPSPDRLAGTAEVPDALGRLVGRMLAKSPDDRPESVLAVRNELEEIRRERGYREIRVDPEVPLEQAVAEWIHDADSGVVSADLALPETGNSAAPHDTGSAAVDGAETPSSTSNERASGRLRVPEGSGGDGAPPRSATARLEESTDGAASSPTPGDRATENPSIGEMLEQAAAGADGDEIEPWLYVLLPVLTTLALVAGGLIWLVTSTESNADASAPADPPATAPADPPAESESAPPTESAEKPPDREPSGGGRAAEAPADESPSEGAEPEQGAESEEQPAETERPEAESPPVEKAEDESGGTETARPERDRGETEDSTSGDEASDGRESSAGTAETDEETESGGSAPTAAGSGGGDESGADESSGDEGFQPVTPSISNEQSGSEASSDGESSSGDGDEPTFEPVVD